MDTCLGLTDLSAPAFISDQVSSSILRSSTVALRLIVLIREPDCISHSLTVVPEAVAQRVPSHVVQMYTLFTTDSCVQLDSDTLDRGAEEISQDSGAL